MPRKVLPARAEKAQFRERPIPGEVLAIDPKAFFLFFSMGNRETELTDEGVAIVNIQGPLEHKSCWFFDSYEAILSRMTEACEDEDVRAIVMKIDSPGGDVAGLYECVAAIQRLRKTHGKPIYAYADELAASAAYALACAADEVFMPEAAGVGSIGVISVMGEQVQRDKKDGFRFEVITSGERKADGNPHIPISEGARKRVERRVDTCADMFFRLVAKSRRLKVREVEGYQADVFYGADAVENRLADGLSSWPDFLASVVEQFNQLDNPSTSLSRSTQKPTDRSDGSEEAKDTTMGLLALRKKRDEALAAFKKAKTIKANKEAAAVYSKACEALARAEALTEARKMKKTRYVEETYKDDADDAAEEEEPEDEDAEDASDSGSAEDDAAEDAAEDAGAEDAEDDSAELEASDEDEDIQAADLGKGGKALLSRLGKLTGQRSVGGIVGAVRGALENSKRVNAVARELRTIKVNGMIEQARKDGRLEKGLVAWARQTGMRSPNELAAYLKAKAPQVRTTEDDALVPVEVTGALAGSGLTKEQAEIATRMGMKPEEAAEVLKKTNGKISNGAARR